MKSDRCPPVLLVIGTRPEAIKMAPVVEAITRQGLLRPVLVATSQHREMLCQALRPFGIAPDVDLDLMRPRQIPTLVLAEALNRLQPLLEAQPSWLWMIVQGDSTTALAAAIAAFQAGIPVAHVEAGLRTGCIGAPFPEEFNRRTISLVAALHLCPTAGAARNLLREGTDPARVRVVGNTVVDAVLRIRAARPVPRSATPYVVLTMHRRESFGAALAGVLAAVRSLAQERPGRLRIVFPVHPNPSVAEPARQILGGIAGVELVPPFDYPEFLDLCAGARFLLSDSGGVQEEAPTLRVPVLILREQTERPEVVDSGWGKLVGTQPDRILAAARRLLDDDDALAAMTRGPQPFGDGHSGEAIARALWELSPAGGGGVLASAAAGP